MIHIKITKKQRIDNREVTDITEINGDDPGEVMAFLDELGHTVAPVNEDKTETVR